MRTAPAAKLKLLTSEGPTPVTGITLVDSADSPEEVDGLADTQEDQDEAAEIAAMVHAAKAQDSGQLQRDDDSAKSSVDVSMLTLSPANIRRATEIGGTFRNSGNDAKIGERLLEELVSGEVGIALELRDIEGALASLVGKTVTDPTLVIAVMKALREVIAANGSVRGRMERSLAAAANLRAQRRFLRAQHGRLGG